MTAELMTALRPLSPAEAEAVCLVLAEEMDTVVDARELEYVARFGDWQSFERAGKHYRLLTEFAGDSTPRVTASSKLETLQEVLRLRRANARLEELTEGWGRPERLKRLSERARLSALAADHGA